MSTKECNLEDLIPIEEIDYIKSVHAEIADYIQAINQCKQVLTELATYKAYSYQINYYIDAKTNEYLFIPKKQEVGFKIEERSRKA
jgi:hypothetical protein